MIQLSGSVSKSPSCPLRALNVNKSSSVAGKVSGSPLRLKFKLKLYAALTMLCPKR
jgi:hypothetical protein